MILSHQDRICFRERTQQRTHRTRRQATNHFIFNKIRAGTLLTYLTLSSTFFIQRSVMKKAPAHRRRAQWISLLLLLLLVLYRAPQTTSLLMVPSSRSSLSLASLSSSKSSSVWIPLSSFCSRRLLPSTKSPSKSILCMHLGGHSHSHEHAIPNNSSSSHEKKKPLLPLRQRLSKRPRLVAMILFCALSILGPPLVKTRRLAETDVAAFGVTTAALFLIEPLRKYVKKTVKRLRQLGSSISRHRTAGSGSFFRTDNAADRVTLLGYVRTHVHVLIEFCGQTFEGTCLLTRCFFLVIIYYFMLQWCH